MHGTTIKIKVNVQWIFKYFGILLVTDYHLTQSNTEEDFNLYGSRRETLKFLMNTLF